MQRSASLEPSALFVYGTLMPGHLRWPLLREHSLGQRPATVPGVLYDTLQGWPAAVFGPPDGDAVAHCRVPGVVVIVRSASLAALLVRIDEVEETASGLYRRVVVRTEDGEPCWAWSFARPVDSMLLIDAWQGRPER